MSLRHQVSHQITLPLPVHQCQRLFTPAGEELYLEGWQPGYIVPADGRTEAGMVFTTGAGEQLTVWTLIDFDTERHHTRYSRVMPALRSDIVDVQCQALDAYHTRVRVSYTLTALTAAGERSMSDFDDAAFAARIDGWKRAIGDRLPQLRTATIR